MKLRFVLLAGIIVGLVCCSKENNNLYKSNGKIMGPDRRMCVCCGGWYIQIDSVTYDFDSIPGNSDINLLKDAFPINVKLDWQKSSTYCTNFIMIERIKKI